MNSNSNVTISVSGTSNVLVLSNNLATLTGNLSVSSNVSVTGNIIGNAILSTTTITGNTTISNGFYSTGSYVGSFTNGIVVDYTSGNGRISVGTGNGLQVYNGGVASNLIFSLASTGNANITGALNVANGANLTGNVTASNLTVSGNLLVAGAFTMQQTYEVVNNINGATGTVIYDFTTGGTFYHTSPAAAWTQQSCLL